MTRKRIDIQELDAAVLSNLSDDEARKITGGSASITANDAITMTIGKASVVQQWKFTSAIPIK